MRRLQTRRKNPAQHMLEYNLLIWSDQKENELCGERTRERAVQSLKGSVIYL